MPTRPAGQCVGDVFQSLQGPPKGRALRVASVCLSHVQCRLGGSGPISKLLRWKLAFRFSDFVASHQLSLVSGMPALLTQAHCIAHRPAPREQFFGPC